MGGNWVTSRTFCKKVRKKNKLNSYLIAEDTRKYMGVCGLYRCVCVCVCVCGNPVNCKKCHGYFHAHTHIYTHVSAVKAGIQGMFHV